MGPAIDYPYAVSALATVATMTALAKAALTDGVQVQVAGYSALNDGGGGIFYWYAGSSTSANGGTVFAADEGGTGRWKRVYVGELINILWFGAVGDGAVDDSTKITAAEAAAFAVNHSLLFPAGYTFTFNGKLQPRVNILGYGATLKQKSAAEVVTNNFGVLYYTGKSNLSVSGLTIDGNFKSSGVGIEGGGSNIRMIDVTVQNTIHYGFGTINHTRPQHVRCRSLDCRYPAGGAGPADGFYFEDVDDGWVADCYSYRPRRIGFVCEGDATHKCNRMKFDRCITEEPHNCDDSATEYNAGFWAENTNSVDWTECVGINIASGTGQTSGRVRGMVVYANGADAAGVATATRCKIYGGTNRLVIAYVAYGTSTYGKVILTDCYAEKVQIGASTLGALDSLSIINLRVHDIVAAAAHGGVVVDGAGPTTMNELAIDGLRLTSATIDADSGWVNVYARTTGTKYTLRNVHGATHVMRAPFDTVLVDHCTISVGSNTYSSILGDTLTILGPSCKWTLRAGVRATKPLIDSSSLASGAVIRIAGGEFTSIVNEFGGTAVQLFIEGGRFDACRFDLSITGTHTTKVDGATAINILTEGFMRADYAASTAHTFIVQGCHFTASNVVNTPLNKWNDNPTTVVIHDNTYNTTAVHDFTATTSVVNNIAI